MTRDTDLIRRSLVKHNRDLLLDQCTKADTGDEELDHGHRMYRAGVRDLARRLMLAPTATQEPVAWQQRLTSGGWGTILHGNDKPIGESRPLFAHPVQNPPTPMPVVPAEGLDALVDGWDTLKDNLPPDGHSAAEALFDYGDKLADAIQALRAQQPAAPVSGVTVKPLVWEDQTCGSYCWVQGLHYYTEGSDEDRDWYVSCMIYDEDVWQGENQATRDECKALAQADYTSRILAALLPAGEGE